MEQTNINTEDSNAPHRIANRGLVIIPVYISSYLRIVCHHDALLRDYNFDAITDPRHQRIIDMYTLHMLSFTFLPGPNQNPAHVSNTYLILLIDIITD